jgi:hypothetical protein
MQKKKLWPLQHQSSSKENWDNDVFSGGGNESPIMDDLAGKNDKAGKNAAITLSAA